MDRVVLNADERAVLGKKVKALRESGKLPGHVYGKKVETEHVAVETKNFLKTFSEVGSTGVIDLKIGAEKVRPVMIKGVQFDPVDGMPLHIDFYQVNLSEKVKVPTPIVLVGEEPENVKLGEAIVLQTINEIEVEALPTDLVENIEVNIEVLKNIDDAITVGQLSYNREKLTVAADPDEVVVKLAPAVSAEMQELLEEQAAETEAAQAEAAEGEEGEAKAEGEEGESAEGEEGAESAEGEAPAEGGEEKASEE